jgi:hypothetical protein
MPAINLPNGQSAILFSNDEISERTNRMISNAFMKAAATAAKITSLGYDDKKPETWEIDEADQANLNCYQEALIIGMVKSWSFGDLPTAESVLDLPKPTFDALSSACADEYIKTADFSPDIDPKAPTAD